MSRDPSIHLRLSDLTLVLENIAELYSISPKHVKTLAEDILKRGKHLSCSQRAIAQGKVNTQAEKILLSSRDDAGQFSILLAQLRKGYSKHRGVKAILPSDKDWPKVKELTGLANEFVKDFGLPKKEGYSEFIKALLDKCGNGYALFKLPSLVPKVYEHYRAKELVNQDFHPELTKGIFDQYHAQVAAAVGVSNHRLNLLPENYIAFIKASEILSYYKGVTPEIYVKAQFEGLAWTGSIPSISQLSGTNAAARLEKYLVKNEIRVNKPTRKIDWDNIRKR